MTPGSQQPQEYIITEEQLKRALAYRIRVLKFMEPNERKDWENFIAECRSRPHTSARSEQEIRADEREKVLDRLDKEIATKENEMNRKASQTDDPETLAGYAVGAGSLNWVRKVLIEGSYPTIRGGPE